MRFTAGEKHRACNFMLFGIYMKIIAHRGLWGNKTAPNTHRALTSALERGFGVETDIRDYQGDLVISHDIADSSSMKLEYFFSLYASQSSTQILALNIKADGLQQKLIDLLVKYRLNNYFVFDMSLPEQLRYIAHKPSFRVFTRQSEYETEPYLYDLAAGVWLDAFKSDWISHSILAAHLAKGKLISLVSPELHSRDFRHAWTTYKSFEIQTHNGDLFLCTDFPEDARRFFNVQD